MRALPVRVEVWLKDQGYNPREFKYLGLANAGASFSKPGETYSIPADPLKPHYPLSYVINFTTKEVLKVDSTD